MSLYTKVTMVKKVVKGERIGYGLTYTADQLHYEIAKVVLMDELPKHWTYPDIQPYLIQHYQMMKENG